MEQFVREMRMKHASLQVNKFNDFNIAFQTMRLIEERLQFAFMLNTSVQRNNDRVTATEINYVSKELDDSLGGLYSLLSQELQLPLINRLCSRWKERKHYQHYLKKVYVLKL